MPSSGSGPLWPAAEELQGPTGVRRPTAMALAWALLIALLLWFAGQWLLLIFLGMLGAVLLRTAADWVGARTGITPGWSLALVVVLIVGAAAIATAAFLPSLAGQVDELSRELPRAAGELSQWLRQFDWGERLVAMADPDDAAADLVQPAAAAASSVVSAIVGIVIVMFVALYLAAEPQTYRRGLLRLVPVPSRARVSDTIDAAVHTLRWWLFGQLLAMAAVGLVMGVGLAIIGVRLAFVFGVLAGILEFVPVFGPPLALLPPLLIALVESTRQALAVLVLYAIVQMFESYVLTPLVHRRTVRLPPVLTIAAQVVLVALVGPIGLVAAVPLMAVLIVVVQKLYVEDVLGDARATAP
jgi:predicted PurR-regulated permease PerM